MVPDTTRIRSWVRYICFFAVGLMVIAVVYEQQRGWRFAGDGLGAAAKSDRRLHKQAQKLRDRESDNYDYQDPAESDRIKGKISLPRIIKEKQVRTESIKTIEQSAPKGAPLSHEGKKIEETFVAKAVNTPTPSGDEKQIKDKTRVADSEKTKVEEDIVHQLNDDEVFVYSAFLDRRLPNKPMMRMFGVHNRKIPIKFKCNFSSQNITLSTSIEKIYPIYQAWPAENMTYIAYSYSCAAPEEYVTANRKSFTFSLTNPGEFGQLPLKPTEMGLVKEGRGELAVCVKAIWGKLDPIKLIEWFEFNLELGVEKLILYDTGTFGKATQVLNLYQAKGVAEVVPFNYLLKLGLLTLKDPMKEKLNLLEEGMYLEQGYLVAINDCLFRYRDQFKYILVVDIDEVLVPANNESLVAMMKRASATLKGRGATGYSFDIVCHFTYFQPLNDTSIPFYLSTQRYVQQTQVMRSQPKTIFDTDGVLVSNWHGVCEALTEAGYDKNFFLDWRKFALLHHWRGVCKYGNECDGMNRNSTMGTGDLAKYKDVMISRVSRVMKVIGL